MYLIKMVCTALNKDVIFKNRFEILFSYISRKKIATFKMLNLEKTEENSICTAASLVLFQLNCCIVFLRTSAQSEQELL